VLPILSLKKKIFSLRKTEETPVEKKKGNSQRKKKKQNFGGKKLFSLLVLQSMER